MAKSCDQQEDWAESLYQKELLVLLKLENSVSLVKTPVYFVYDSSVIKMVPTSMLNSVES